ncbi:MAG: helix-turn-helix domain-containing protein [Alphaproteobacteria bacterium]
MSVYSIYIQTEDALLARLLENALQAQGFTIVAEKDVVDLVLQDRGNKLSLTVSGVEKASFNKPLSMNALLQAVKEYSGQEREEIDLGICIFKVREKLLQHKENTTQQTHLREKEADILLYLLKNKGEPVKKEELLENIWGYNAAIETKTLETHIYRLRKKLEEALGKNTLLVAEEGCYKIEDLF